MVSILLKIGILIFFSSVFAIIFKLLKQSTIIAFIITGIVSSLFAGMYSIPTEIFEAFSELGIILLLFMIGLELDLDNFKKRLELILKNGLGQIFLNFIIVVIIGVFLLGIQDLQQLAFFGICLTLSSSVIVLSYLKNKKEIESLHGQLLIGLMVLQDIVAVLAIAILNIITGSKGIISEVGLLAVKFIGIALLLYILSKFVFEKLFHFLTKFKGLLLIGSFGIVMGIASLSELINFSTEISAFLTGVSLSFLPYTLEIEDKIEPLKELALMLFFISLGHKLSNPSIIFKNIDVIILLVVLINFGTSIIMLFIGFLNRLKSRTSFYMGGIINQISEFSLILAVLCREQEIFSEEIFIIITSASVITMILSCIGHEYLENIYIFLEKYLGFFDSHSIQIDELGKKEYKDHIILIKYNELSEKIIEHYCNFNIDIFVLDTDPDIIDKNIPEENVHFHYLDAYDPDTRELAYFDKAALIVSCLIEGQKAELGILNWLQENDLSIPFVSTTDSRKDAARLYEAGASYVIQTEDLAAQKIEEIIEKVGNNFKEFKSHGDKHKEKLKQIRLGSYFDKL